MNKFSVIGLGTAGCQVAKCFQKYPQYRVYQIGENLVKGKYSYVLPHCRNPEDYENNPPKLKTFFRLVSGDVLFIVAGGSVLSAASLVILEQIKHCNISILYIKPDTDMLNNVQENLDKVAFNVLQEYSRSAVFNQLYLTSNSMIEDLLGDLVINERFKKINETIASTLHMLHVFNNSEPIINNLTAQNEIAKIKTYGILNIDTGEEKLFFPLANVLEKEYYYAIGERDIRENKQIFKTIKNQIKIKKEENRNTTYAVYSTEYKENFAYIMARSNQIQKGDLSEGI